MLRPALVAASLLVATLAHAADPEAAAPAAPADVAPNAEAAAQAAEPEMKTPLRLRATADRGFELRLGAGIGSDVRSNATPYIDGYLDAVLGVTDRLQLSLADFAIAYRFGEAGKTEWVPYAGFASARMQQGRPQLSFALKTGLDSRIWLRNWSLFATGISVANANNEWNAGLYAGVMFQLADRVVLNLGVSEKRLWAAGATPGDEIVVGSVITGGGRRQPLLGVRLTDTVWLELHGMTAVNAQTGAVNASAMAGIAWVY